MRIGIDLGGIKAHCSPKSSPAFEICQQANDSLTILNADK